jgi:hypothetical protein
VARATLPQAWRRTVLAERHRGERVHRDAVNVLVGIEDRAQPAYIGSIPVIASKKIVIGIVHTRWLRAQSAWM